MRTAYDSVTASNIPTSAQIVAGYVDGRYRWSAADWARFPNSVHVPIACFPWTNDGVVLDVETGDATPTQAPGWVRMRRAAGVDPTVYCSLAWWPSVRAAFIAQGIPEPHYWIAAYPGNGPNLYIGSVAHQYANPGPYDLSVVAVIWPGVDGPSTVANVIAATPTGAIATPAPLPAPAVTAKFVEDDMKDYVISLYVLLLGRMPDVTGLADDLYQLITGKKTLADIEDGIRGSDEFKNLDPNVRVQKRLALPIW